MACSGKSDSGTWHNAIRRGHCGSQGERMEKEDDADVSGMAMGRAHTTGGCHLTQPPRNKEMAVNDCRQRTFLAWLGLSVRLGYSYFIRTLPS